MTDEKLSLADLVMRSRSLSVGEKQEFLKKIHAMPKEEKAKMYEILNKEYLTFQELDKQEAIAINVFTETLKILTNKI